MTRLCSRDVGLEIFEDTIPARMFSVWGLAERSEGGHEELSKAMVRRTGERLRECTALQLLVLEFLLEAAGGESLRVVKEVVAARSSVSESHVEAVVDQLAVEGLCVIVTVGFAAKRAVALWSPMVTELWDRLLGVSLPDPRDRAPGAYKHGPEVIAALAAAGLACQHKVKATRSSQPHRGDVKKHARRLGMDPEDLFDSLERAFETGLVVVRDGLFEPQLDRMEAIVRDPPAQSILWDWLGDVAVSQEELARAIALARYADGPNWLDWEDYPETLLESRGDAAGSSLQLEEHDGRLYVSVPQPAPPPASVEGFVTPNLEVMIGPDPDPLAVAQVGVFAELTKLDRVVTFQLRPKTVARAVLRGVSGEQIVAQLARVGRHGVPESVQIQVLDWAESARVAHATPATLLTLPPRLCPGVLLALGDRARQVGDGELLVSREVGAPELERLLTGLKIELGGTTAQSPSRATDAPEMHVEEFYATSDLPPRPLSPLPARPDEELRRRVREERAQGFAPSLAGLDDEAEVRNGAPGAEELLEAAKGLPKNAAKAVRTLVRLHREQQAELRAWAEREPEDVRSEAYDLISSPAEMLPVLVLVPAARRRALGEGEFMLEEAVKLVAAGKLSAAGRRIARVLPALEHILERRTHESDCTEDLRALLREWSKNRQLVKLSWIGMDGDVREEEVTILELREFGEFEFADVRVEKTRGCEPVPLGRIIGARAAEPRPRT